MCKRSGAPLSKHLFIPGLNHEYLLQQPEEASFQTNFRWGPLSTPMRASSKKLSGFSPSVMASWCWTGSNECPGCSMIKDRPVATSVKCLSFPVRWIWQLCFTRYYKCTFCCRSSWDNIWVQEIFSLHFSIGRDGASVNQVKAFHA